MQQNRRCSHVFRRRRPDGTWDAYDSTAIVFDEGDGMTYTSFHSRAHIRFPYVVPKHPYIAQVRDGSWKLPVDIAEARGWMGFCAGSGG